MSAAKYQQSIQQAIVSDKKNVQAWVRSFTHMVWFRVANNENFVSLTLVMKMMVDDLRGVKKKKKNQR